MKKWKKWLTILLSTVMVGSFAVACNEGDDSSTPAGGNSSESSSNADDSTSSGGGTSSDDSTSSGGGTSSDDSTSSGGGTSSDDSTSSGGGTSSDDSTSSGGGTSSDDSTSSGGGTSSDDSTSSGGGTSSDDDSTLNADAQAYVEAIENMLKETRSLQMTSKIDMTEIGTPIKEDGSLDTANRDVDGVDVSVQMTFSLDDSNALSVYMLAEMEEVYEDGVYIEIAEMMLVGNGMYMRYYEFEKGAAESTIEKGYWEKEDLPFEELSVEAVVNSIMGEGGMTIIEDLLSAKEIGELQVAMKEAYVQAFAAILEAELIQEDKISVSMDLAPTITDWVTYLNAIDETKVTLAQFVEDTAEKMGIPMTYDTLLVDIATFGEKTVADAFDNLDTFAQANFNMTLQEMYDAALETELATKIFALIPDMDADALAQIKAFQLVSLKEEYGTIKFKELFNIMMAQVVGGNKQEGGSGSMDQPMPTSEDSVEDSVETPEEVDYWTELLGMLNQAKTMTLAETLGVIPEIPLKADELSFATEVAFGANKAISSIAISYAIDMEMETVETDYYYDKETGEKTEIAVPYHVSIDMTCSATISAFSKDEVAITAPTIDEIEMYLEGQTESVEYKMDVNPEGIEYGNLYVLNPLGGNPYLCEMGFRMKEGETFAYGTAVTVVATWYTNYATSNPAMGAYINAGLYEFEVTVSKDGTVEFGTMPSMDTINAWYAEQYPDQGQTDK